MILKSSDKHELSIVRKMNTLIGYYSIGLKNVYEIFFRDEVSNYEELKSYLRTIKKVVKIV